VVDGDDGGGTVSLSISTSAVVIAAVSRDVLPISPWLFFYVSKFFFFVETLAGGPFGGKEATPYSKSYYPA
jgi:hypothetical protein